MALHGNALRRIRQPGADFLHALALLREVRSRRAFSRTLTWYASASGKGMTCRTSKNTRSPILYGFSRTQRMSSPRSFNHSTEVVNSRDGVVEGMAGHRPDEPNLLPRIFQRHVAPLLSPQILAHILHQVSTFRHPETPLENAHTTPISPYVVPPSGAVYVDESRPRLLSRTLPPTIRGSGH